MASLAVNGVARITRDPDIKRVSGGSWCNFTIAAYRKKAKDGKQAVDFFDAQLYLKEGSDLDKTIKKGNLIYLETAYLRNDVFKGQDGTDKSKMKILIMSFDVLKTEAVSSVSSESVHPSDLPPPMAIKMELIKKQEPIQELTVVPEDMFSDEEPPF
jgi:single-stranded DNA-binding protein